MSRPKGLDPFRSGLRLARADIHAIQHERRNAIRKADGKSSAEHPDALTGASSHPPWRSSGPSSGTGARLSRRRSAR